MKEFHPNVILSTKSFWQKIYRDDAERKSHRYGTAKIQQTKIAVTKI